MLCFQVSTTINGISNQKMLYVYCVNLNDENQYEKEKKCVSNGEKQKRKIRTNVADSTLINCLN